jgi:hypothetical protein
MTSDGLMQLAPTGRLYKDLRILKRFILIDQYTFYERCPHMYNDYLDFNNGWNMVETIINCCDGHYHNSSWFVACSGKYFLIITITYI